MRSVFGGGWERAHLRVVGEDESAGIGGDRPAVQMCGVLAVDADIN
ncbi:hypothetical protein [Gordonia soli]|nr:hypothetical protein [Gordonia soli]